ncbi:hypothetical protein G6O67_008195 [Ophiocordyceps sinensis]|uniref:Chromo domain-containing protein n=1 Tax=Ophiocordyceps sinensis TaxID=72228 RepID=A0A8H4PH12_9HYPO|nr:hypothetical protein G6O67_008195 [Ophiocordyceps sinensis]
MPPALSEDEASDVEPQPAASWRKSASVDEELLADASFTRNGSKPAVEVEDEDEDGDEAVTGNGDGDDGEGDDGEGDDGEVDDGEGGDGDGDEEVDLDEDEFIVEAIKKHMVDEDGSLKFLVKWEGWEKKSDLTWEPEDNLMESASEVLQQYYKRLGGRDRIFEESEKATRGKKRGRASGETSVTATKRSRKNGLHPAESSPPATSKKWSPPAGSWEDEIESIDACEDEGSGRLVVYLIWKNGRKTKHDTSVIYKKCPQKMLQFYERHVKIIRDENKAAAE